MDENASRAVFIGVSVFVAVITLSFIIKFYATAKETAAEVNRYDISSEYNSYTNDVLKKRTVTGSELRYLMNYFQNNKEINICIDNQIIDPSLTVININNNNKWNEDYANLLDKYIRPNYKYGLVVDKRKSILRIIATFEN